MNYLEIYEKLMSLSEEEIKFKIEHMKNLINTKSELSIEYLKLLYLYLGTTQELIKIKNDRNILEDLKKIFECHDDEIGLDINDFYNKKVKYFYSKENYLSTRQFDIKPNVSNLEVIIGGLNIDFNRPLSFNNLKLITGNFRANKFEKIDGLGALEVVNGSFECEDLLYDDNFLNLKLILGICDLKSLKKLDKLKNCEILDKIILNDKTKNKELIEPKKLILESKKELDYMKKHISYFTD